MRVITLLPAATEIVASLGGAGHLVGISHECDYPASVQRLPRVTTTPVNVSSSGAAIDAEVRRLVSSGRPVIGIDADMLRRLAPDLVIAQSLCDVCAVADGEAHRLSAALDPPPRVLSLEARNLEGIWGDIRRIGTALELQDEAEELVLGLKSRLARVRAERPTKVPRVVCLEWLEPLYLAGHWVPELVAAAGGQDVGAEPGSHSRQGEWKELGSLSPDHAIVMLCGFGVGRARAELDALRNPEALDLLSRPGFGVGRARAELDALRNPEALDLLSRVPVSIIDGNAYTSRPGPRVVDGADRIRAALAGWTIRGIERWQKH